MSSLKDNFVKVAVEMEAQIPHLTYIDQNTPLNAVIQQFLTHWNIDEPSTDYSFQFNTHLNTYVNEKNRTEITDGTMLRLIHSPSKITRDILDKLQNSSGAEKRSALETLVKFSFDYIFAAEFIEQKGKDFLTMLIEQDSIKPNEGLGLAFEAFIELMNHGICIWDSVERKFVEKVAQQINTGYDSSDPKILSNALAILENLLISGTKFNSLIESEITLPNLMKHVQMNSKNPLIQQNAIALVNALLIKSDLSKKKAIAATLSSKYVREIILENIVNNSRQEDTGFNHVGSEMAHQLYILQTSLFNLHEERMHLSPSTSSLMETFTREKITELTKLVFENEWIGTVDLNQKSKSIISSSSSIKSCSSFKDDYMRLGFINCKNPAEDFNDCPPGLFAFDLMLYFARNYTETCVKVVLENCCRSDREHECPFARSSIQITKLIAEIFKIGEGPSDEGKIFYPMFFTHDHPIEEFFCICVPLLNKTWKEMRASVEDFAKVFSVLRQQLTRALADSEAIFSFDKFKIKLNSLTYSAIMNIWQKERTSREEWENKAQAILELRERLKPSIIELIKQQRLRYLTEGTEFVKYSNKGQRIKDKFWFCRLSNKKNVFYYGDCEENKIPSIDELPHKLSISDIKHLYTGKECAHMKEGKNSKKSTFVLAFSLAPDQCQGEPLNFVAPNEKAFDYWTDGINALLGNEMVSKEAQNDLATLLSMEVKLRLLDTEGITIPEVPPKIPPPPSNYDFNIKYS